MTFKALFGLTILPAAFLAGIIVACLSKRLRDLFFVLLVVLTPLIERLDLNFVSRDFYRGTSRGFEISVLHILAVSLLVSSILAPRPDDAVQVRRTGWLVRTAMEQCAVVRRIAWQPRPTGRGTARRSRQTAVTS